MAEISQGGGHSSEILVHIGIRQLLQICQMHLQDANLPFYHTPKVLYCIAIWLLWRPLEYSGLIVI